MRSRFDDLHESLVEAVAGGVSFGDACRRVGISEHTARGWLRQGRRDGSGRYASFARAIDDARNAGPGDAEPMTMDGLFVVVSQAARRGSVQAMRLAWEMLKANSGLNRDAGLRELDELARRRRAGVSPSPGEARP